MRAFIATILLTACLQISVAFSLPATLTPASAATPTREIIVLTPTGYIGEVTPLRQDVNVRICPSTSCAVDGTLRYGDKLPLLQVGEAWVRVEYFTRERWIARQVVRITQP